MFMIIAYMNLWEFLSLTGGIFFNIYSFPFKFHVKLCIFYDANADMKMR